VTDPEAYQRKVAPIRDSLPDLEFVLIVDDRSETAAPATPVPEGMLSWSETMSAATSVLHRDGFTIAATRPQDPALLHFTSGTTGRPKGAVHVHEAVVAHHATTRFALDLRPGDIFWCTGDPGWVTGTSYGIIGPLTCGATVVTDAADFDARRWYGILEQERVAVFYTAPTALRMLMRKGVDLAREHDLSALKHVVSVGEPLNPEAVFWGLEAFNMPVHDTWWQTETGAIMISNYPGMPIRPGSMDGRCPASRSRCWKEARTGEPTSSKAKSGSWPSPGSTASWRCDLAGRRCSGHISTTPAGMRRRLPMGGISPAT
jgi:acetyl-CoA synthetase